MNSEIEMTPEQREERERIEAAFRRHMSLELWEEANEYARRMAWLMFVSGYDEGVKHGKS